LTEGSAWRTEIQEMLRSWPKIAVMFLVVIAAGVVATVCFVVFRLVKCDYMSETPAPSPDGKWVVTATTRACPCGPLSSTNYDVFVTLSAGASASPPIAGMARIFENDGAAEPPGVSWTGVNEVTLKIADFGAVRTSKHQFENIRIKYVVPWWIWDRLGEAEADHAQEDRDSMELFRAGKMSGHDLRISLETHQGVADEMRQFRQWVVENASVEGKPPAVSKSRTLTP